MISTSIPHDAALPQLAIVLDGKRMGAHFTSHLFGANAENQRFVLKNCVVERVRYKPGRNCLVSYKLTLEEIDTQIQREQVVCGRIYPAGGGEPHFQKARRSTFAPTEIGPPLIHIAPLEMVAWLYPNERKLGGLPALADDERMCDDILPRVVAAGWGDDWALRKTLCEVIHYVPEHTLSVRASLSIEHRVTGEIRNPVVFGKTYYNGHGYTTYHKMRRLWAISQARSTALKVPRPLLYQPELNLLWQEGVNGTTLLAHERRQSDAACLYARAGAAVGMLHRSVLRCRSTVTDIDIVTRLMLLPREIGDQLPVCSTTLQRVIDNLIAHQPGARQDIVATLHGDLHPQNIFVSGEEIYLIDLDNLINGPPLADVGSFIAETLYRTLLSGKPVVSKFGLISRFVAGYAANVPWPVDSVALAWFTAAALLNERVYRCVSRLKPGRTDLIPELIDLAERVSRGEFLPC
jgi:tRNA A-37 threonylcarbamoyl transferase component Bud32